MFDLSVALSTAFALVTSFDPQMLAIVRLSVQVSGGAVLLAALIGLPLGPCWPWPRFRGVEPWSC